MADYTMGLLKGLQDGIATYARTSSEREDRELRSKMMDAELKAKGLIQVKDPLSGETSFQQDPEFLKQKQYEQDVDFYKSGLIPQRDESGLITGAGVNEEFFKAKTNADPMTGMLRELQLDKAKRERDEAERRMTPQGKLESMSGEQKKRFDQSIAARNAVEDIDQAYSGLLKNEQPGLIGKMSRMSDMVDVPLRGDTPFTESRRRFEEYLGRLQSGGQISEGESKRFRSLMPAATDDSRIGQQKLKNLSQELETSITSTGISPDQARDMGFLRPSSAGAAPKPKTVIQNGVTYTLNPQTGQYE